MLIFGYGCVCFQLVYRIKADTQLNAQLQRHKNSYSMYPKTDPTPVTSSAPPVSTLYTSPVVRLFPAKSLILYKTCFHDFKSMFERFFIIVKQILKCILFWLLWNTLQNSSAPSAEDVDPEVHVVYCSSQMLAVLLINGNATPCF